MMLADSYYFSEQFGILFAIFGHVVQKLLNLQIWIEICLFILISEKRLGRFSPIRTLPASL